MSESALFEYLCKLREEIQIASSKITGDANETQLYYRVQYLEKLGIYHNAVQLLEKDINRQILRVSDHIKTIKRTIEQR